MDDKRAGRSLGIRSFFSILGFKIAVTVGFFMFVSLLSHFFFHEYKSEGFSDVVSFMLDPYWWAGIVVPFIALMLILSKMFILPLKKLEMHISDAEAGRNKGPFVLKSRDELAYLANAFNSMHKHVSGEIESRETQLSVVNEFMASTSGVFEIPVLMDGFFTVLRSVLPFNSGGYLLSYRGHTEARVYISSWSAGDDDAAASVAAALVRSGKEMCAEFPLKVPPPSVMRLNVASPPAAAASVAYVDLPIVCYGRAIGVITLASSSVSAREAIVESKTLKAMASHVSIVVERLLRHIIAEEQKLSDIMSSMAEGVYFVDRDGHVSAMNRTGLELAAMFCAYGGECANSGFLGGIEGCRLARKNECALSVFLNGFSAAGDDGRPGASEIRSTDGVTLQFNVNALKSDGAKSGYVITGKDVTEERMIQKRIMLSSKLAALGEMAAGIAHEVNNPLQVMMANIELLDGTVEEKGKKRVGYLKEGILRIKAIVKDLLVFAREQTTDSDSVDVRIVVDKVVDIVGRQLKVANVNVAVEYDPGELLVKCNRNLLQQVLINLLHNAKDAIEESGCGKKVTIRTAPVADDSVLIEVADDGPGIPEKIIDRIFDPFFTTKDVGKGTGLGLSVSRRIVEGMGGSIHVSSVVGRGTRFSITLKRSLVIRRGLEVPQPRMESAQDYSMLAGKSVFIVDDEVGVIKAVQDVIASIAGVSVESAANGLDALEAVMDNDFDVIFMDIKMPGMNGMELFKRLSDVKPYLAHRVVFLTGDVESETTAAFLKLSGCRYLAKPFSLKELLDVMSLQQMEAN